MHLHPASLTKNLFGGHNSLATCATATGQGRHSSTLLLPIARRSPLLHGRHSKDDGIATSSRPAAAHIVVAQNRKSRHHHHHQSSCNSSARAPGTPTMPKPKRNINAVAEDTLTPPASLPETQTIARLKQAAGKNLYHLELPDGETILAELPSKFRSTIWLKRGSYVVVDAAALADRDNKLKGEIVNIVGDEKAWRKMPYWPAEFTANKSVYEEDSEDEGPQMPPSDSEEED